MTISRIISAAILGGTVALVVSPTTAVSLPPRAYDIYYYALEDVNREGPPVGHWCYDCTYGTFNSCRYGYKTTNFEAMYGDDCWVPPCNDVQYDDWGFTYCGDRPEAGEPDAPMPEPDDR